MLTLFFYHKNFMTAILALLSLSIICQTVLGVLYCRLLHETENMSTTRNKSLQQLKMKFSGCHQVHDGISNVPIFVERFLSRLKIGFLPLSFLKHLSGQFTLLAVLIAGIGACISIAADESIVQIAPFYLISFLGLYLYFSLASLIDIPGRQNTLKINLIDYLENHLSNQMEQASEDMQMLQEKEKQKIDDSDSFSEAEAAELELLLKELLL